MKIPGSRSFINITGKFFGKKTPKTWDPYSKIFIKSENSNWVLDSIRNEMRNVCKRISIPLIDEKYGHKLENQCIFFTSKYDALKHLVGNRNKIAFPMYHGNPDNDRKFKDHLDVISEHHNKIDRIQVSNSFMRDVILKTGIDYKKIYQIPISIDIDNFPMNSSKIEKNNAKDALGINKDSFLIGSFQKDGEGWGSGDKPKLIKGPDILVEVIKSLKICHPKIEVLLTGPARGYVKNELKKLNIKFKHFIIDDYRDIPSYYKALDLYLITSREEGGPRSILESMASGVPLVTTKVGQAIDLVEHQENAWMVDVDDTNGLINWSKFIIKNYDAITKNLNQARKTAISNCYDAQLDMWIEFMKGFVIGAEK